MVTGPADARVPAHRVTAEDVVWSYPTPFPGVQQIAGLLAFWPEKPDVTLELNGRPAPSS